MAAAAIGLALYGTLFLFTAAISKLPLQIIRIISSLFDKINGGKNNNKSSSLRPERFNYKKAFYLGFLLFCCCEIGLYGTLLPNDKITLWGFFFLGVGSFLHVLIFAMVINLWGYALNYTNHFRRSTILCLAMVGINLLSTLFSLCYLFVYGGVNQSRSIQLGFIISSVVVQPVTLFILSCILFLYSFRLISLLSQTHTSTPSNTRNTQPEGDVEVKLQLITRVSMISLLCLVCYLLRVFIYSMTAYVFLSPRGSNEGSPFLSSELWFLLCDWIPSIAPGITFLYIMNRSKLKSASTPSSRFPSMSSHQIDSRISWYYEEVEDSDDSSTNDRHSSIWSSPKAKEFFLSGIEIRDSSSVQSPLKFVEEGS